MAKGASHQEYITVINTSAPKIYTYWYWNCINHTSDRNGMKLKINYKEKKKLEYLKCVETKHMLLNSYWINEEIKE